MRSSGATVNIMAWWGFDRARLDILNPLRRATSNAAKPANHLVNALSRTLSTLMSISALTTVARAFARRTSAFISSRLSVSSSSVVVVVRGVRAVAGASEVPLFMVNFVGL
jgi:hypothetical protein